MPRSTTYVVPFFWTGLRMRENFRAGTEARYAPEDFPLKGEILRGGHRRALTRARPAPACRDRRDDEREPSVQAFRG